MLTDTTYNAMLDNQIVSGASNMQLSCHSDYSATGTNLLGSKAVANFSAASSRQKALSAAVDISITAGNTVKWLGLWDAAGTTFKGMQPNGGSDKSFQIDVTTERIYCEAHGMSNGDKLTFHNGTPPTGLTAGVTYFVVGATAGDPDYFQVAATSGGSAINLTGEAAATCVLSKIIEETYGSNGTHRISTFTINL